MKNELPLDLADDARCDAEGGQDDQCLHVVATRLAERPVGSRRARRPPPRSGRGWPIEPTSATSRLNGKPDRPIGDGPDLASDPGHLAHVVGPRHPPGGEAMEAALPKPAHRLVAAEVDEGRLGLVGETASARLPSRARRRCCGPPRGLDARRAERSAGRDPARPCRDRAPPRNRRPPRRPSSPRPAGTRRRRLCRCPSRGQRERPQARVRGDPGGPDDRPRRDPLAGGERGAVGTGLLERVPRRMSMPRPRSSRSA